MTSNAPGKPGDTAHMQSRQSFAASFSTGSALIASSDDVS